jgi:hypothetical protein
VQQPSIGMSPSHLVIRNIGFFIAQLSPIGNEWLKHLRFDHGLEFPAGTRAGFAKATARTHGTGRRRRNSSVFPRMPDSSPVAVRRERVHRCERCAQPKNINLACTWQSITVQNGPIQTGSPGVASHFFRVNCLGITEGFCGLFACSQTLVAAYY